MGSIRKFWFEDSNGTKFDLTDKNKEYFLHSPEGLGFEKDIQTITIGETESIISSKTKIPNPSGEIVFYGKPERGYQDYLELSVFLQHTPLKFYYQPPNVTYSYYIDCVVRKLGKSEYKEDGSMKCPIEIKGLSLWKRNDEQGKGNELVLTNTLDNSKGKYYALERPYAYQGYMLNSIKVYNKGSTSVGFTYEVHGRVVNPVLSAFKDNKMYGLIKLIGTFDVVRVTSIDKKQNIYLEKDGEVLANPILYQDFTALADNAILTFFKFKIGESRLVFNSDNLSSFDGVVILRWEDTFLGG